MQKMTDGIAVVDWPKVDEGLLELIVENGDKLRKNRKYIWCLLLGISQDSLVSTYEPFYADLKRMSQQNFVERPENNVTRLIRVDVPRTFSCYNIPQFAPDLIPKGKNALFNVLTAYA